MRRAHAICCVLLAPLSGCSPVGNGTQDTLEFRLAPFTQVVNGSAVDVRILAGGRGTNLFTCDSNLLPRLLTDIDGEVLTVVPFQGELQPRTECSVDLRTDALTAVEVQGTGSVFSEGPFDGFTSIVTTNLGQARLDGLTADELLLQSGGAGGITLNDVQADAITAESLSAGRILVTGQTDELVVSTLAEGGDVDLRDLAAVSVRVDAGGPGRVDVRASEQAIIRLTGSGDVHVWGAPATIDQVVSGTGRLIMEE